MLLKLLTPLPAGHRWAWHAAILIAIGSLWYLPLGTLLSLLGKRHFIPPP